MIYSTLSRRQHWDGIIDILTEAPDEFKSGQFATILDVQIFAAIVGYKYKKRAELIGDKKDIKGDTVESLQPDLCPQLINLIALAEKKHDSNILKNEMQKERVKIFEEYAEGGFQIIERWLNESNEAFAENMIINQIDAMGALNQEDDNEAGIMAVVERKKKKYL